MTVRELVEILLTCPQDAEVITCAPGRWSDTNNVEVICKDDGDTVYIGED